MTPDPTTPKAQRSQAVEDYLQGAREVLEEHDRPRRKTLSDLIASYFTKR